MWNVRLCPCEPCTLLCSIDNAVLLLPEYVVPTVVYLLAHHEDYGEEDRSLYRIREYVT